MQISLAENRLSTTLFYNVLGDSSSRDADFLSFLQPSYLEYLNGFFSKTPEEIDGASVETLRSIWRNVLVDAIYFLRINDNREAAFYEKTGVTGGDQVKTTMASGGVETAAIANVYGIKELNKYFEQFTEFESVLYGADKFYRDHVRHPINVWITGLNILKEYGKEIYISTANTDDVEIHSCDHAKIEWFPTGGSSEKIKLSTAEISAMWAIIALTHDIGYPLEKVEKVNDKLEKMLAQFGNIGFSRSRFNFENQHDHLVKFLLKLISSVCRPKVIEIKREDGTKAEKKEYSHWTNHLRTKYYTKFSKSWEQFDHGIVSCLLLLKTLTFFIETDYSDEGTKYLSAEDARQFVVRSEILHTIASHTTPKIYHLAVNNLPFLLVLCDDLQEWSRPTLSDIRAGLRGTAKSVKIEKLKFENSSMIECLIHYEDSAFKVASQQDFVKRVFRHWLERLRPALDDNKRTFKFVWKIKFNDSPKPWKFTLDNSKQDNFKKIEMRKIVDEDGNDGAMTLKELLEDKPANND